MQQARIIGFALKLDDYLLLNSGILIRQYGNTDKLLCILLTLQDIRKYCNSKKGPAEEFPFDFKALAFKIGCNMFALTSINSKETIFMNCCDE